MVKGFWYFWLICLDVLLITKNIGGIKNFKLKKAGHYRFCFLSVLVQNQHKTKYPALFTVVSEVIVLLIERETLNKLNGLTFGIIGISKKYKSES